MYSAKTPKSKKNNKPIPLKCDFNNCNCNKNLCMNSRIVYNYHYLKCSGNYIGSTMRQFHMRHNEHIKKDKSSSMYEHKVKCNAEFITTTLD